MPTDAIMGAAAGPLAAPEVPSESFLQTDAIKGATSARPKDETSEKDTPTAEANAFRGGAEEHMPKAAEITVPTNHNHTWS